MSNKFIFLDRDGVINKEIGYLHKIEDFEFIDGVFDSIRYLQKKNFRIVIITNQSGIGRGIYTIDDFIRLNNWMIEEFITENIKITDTFFCPHSPQDDCLCRKPKPGMIKQAVEKYNIDIKTSWLIGDSERDIVAGLNAGIGNTILVKSGHKINEKETKSKFIIDSIADIELII